MTTLPRKKLPLGIQTFSKLRNENCYYADKSGIAVDLIEAGSYYFLSRPRRFGKSLFLDTLKELFEGNSQLFQGLQAEKRWNWEKKHPVISISFSDGVLQNLEKLNEAIKELLNLNRIALDIPLPERLSEDYIAGNFRDLIHQAHIKTGQRVVVLVDEYDKPILDNITNQPIATEMREGLKNFYSVLKGSDPHLQFILLTGVSKFSKVSLFSGLNNLQDITLDAKYSTICGYTNNDVDTVFSPELFDLDREQIRDWYNGYNWLGESVYNPFDLLHLFNKREFGNYWFESGTPEFLIKILIARQQFTPDLSRIIAQDTLLSTFDVDNIPAESLLFQSGYLTIDFVTRFPGFKEFTLKYPNREVQASLNNYLLHHWCGNSPSSSRQTGNLYRILMAHDLMALKNLFHAFFSSIPNDWYRNSPIAQYEGYYASIFYSHFAGLGLDVRLEDITNHGRIDMTVLFNKNVYIFEFKVVELAPKGKALAQIKKCAYADKYRARNEPIHLIGVEFSKENRNIAGFEVETV
jgi:hypothetical protein